MNKEKLLKLLDTKRALQKKYDTQADEIISKENPSAEEVRSLAEINKNSRSLQAEINDLQALYDSLTDDGEGEEQRNNDPKNPKLPLPDDKHPIDGQRSNEPQGGFTPLGSYGTGIQVIRGSASEVDYAKIQKQYEARGAALKEGKRATFNMKEMSLASTLQRSVNLSSTASNLVVPNQYSNTLNPTFNQVSSLVDLVHAIPLGGGESYTKGFVKPSGTDGDYTAEGANYVETDPVFDSVAINKTKITAYSEISEEVKKLPNIDYQSYIAIEVRNALRRKMAKQIMIGNPTAQAQQLVGMFNAPTNVIPAGYDLSIGTIDDDTLDSIVFNYGGDENVESPAFLILNKKDLAAFAAIRDKNGRKIYNITTNGNIGTISSEGSFSVNYVINSICPALSDPNTPANTKCMAYGILQDYELPIFSDVDIEISTDYKFAQGMICYKGSVFVGGNVAAWKGIMRIQKGTATTSSSSTTGA